MQGHSLSNSSEFSDPAERLRRTEQRYEAIIESLKDLVIRIDSSGRFTFVNQAYCRKLGRSAQQLIGTSFDPFVHPEDLAHVRKFVESLKFPPHRGFVEHRSWFSGEWRLTLWEGYAIRDSENQILEFQGVGRDITEQRWMERSLRESEEKFRAAFESSPIAQCTVSLGGHFTAVNSAACELFGYSAEELEKMTFFDLTLEEDRGKGVEALRQLREGKISVYRTEKRYTHKSGRIIHVILASASIRDEKGEPLYFVSQIVDISTRIYQEALLRQHALDLGRSNTDLAQFAYVVAHDIREPLRMVTNFLELLIERSHASLDSESHEYVDFALSGSRRAQELISELLGFAKLDQDKTPENVVDLAKILREIFTTLQITHQRPQAQMRLRNLPPCIQGIESQVVQVFQNLLDNSLKYRSLEEPLLQITCLESAAEYVFKVEDNGIGIEAKYRDLVFKMFQRLHNRDQYPGTGMGLSIVKKIIESRGGRIWIEDSPLLGGCAFVFAWPKYRGRWLGG
jgi:PAS domain S-box-containing protein